MDDIEEPLTPLHLLCGRRILSLPDHLCRIAEPDDADVEARPQLLTRRARHLNNVIDKFWARWRKEYLLELREAHRYHHGHTQPSPVAVDDVVIIHSSEQPRGFWKLGRVKQTLTGRDGKVRGAVLQVFGKGRQAKQLHRPIQVLYPLEVSPPSPDTPDDNNHEQPTPSPNQTTGSESTPDEPDAPSPPQRTRRAAALEARDRILAWTLDET